MARPVDHVDHVLTAVDRLPGVTLAVDRARRWAQIGTGPMSIGRIDLRRARVVVCAQADGIPELLRVFPSARRATDGVRFDLLDDDDATAAVEAISRQARAERWMAQAQVESP